MNSTSSTQKRLNREHHKGKGRPAKTWRAIAAERGINVRWVYDFAVHGIEPKNPAVRRALGLPRLKPPKPVDYTAPWVTEAANNLQQLLDRKEKHV
jgi:hypothetical protein